MSEVGVPTRQMQICTSDLEIALASAEAWKDDQRHRLDRGRIDPLLQAARRYCAGLTDLDRALDRIEASLGGT